MRADKDTFINVVFETLQDYAKISEIPQIKNDFDKVQVPNLKDIP